MNNVIANPTEDTDLRDYYTPGSAQYNAMLNLLHTDASKAQSIYYCGKHHSIETPKTVESHKQNCPIYTRGMILGNLSNFLLNKILEKTRIRQFQKLLD